MPSQRETKTETRRHSFPHPPFPVGMNFKSAPPFTRLYLSLPHSALSSGAHRRSEEEKGSIGDSLPAIPVEIPSGRKLLLLVRSLTALPPIQSMSQPHSIRVMPALSPPSLSTRSTRRISSRHSPLATWDYDRCSSVVCVCRNRNLGLTKEQQTFAFRSFQIRLTVLSSPVCVYSLTSFLFACCLLLC